jgi:uncharacterized protein (TIGR03086 family)
VSGDLWTPPLIAGRTIAAVGDRFDGDVLGADPAAAYEQAAAEAIVAVDTDGALDRMVHLSFGDMPGEGYAWQLFTDHLIHGWDLAQATGGDDRLDPELVATCADWFTQREHAYPRCRTHRTPAGVATRRRPANRPARRLRKDAMASSHREVCLCWLGANRCRPARHPSLAQGPAVSAGGPRASGAPRVPPNVPFCDHSPRYGGLTDCSQW